MMKPNPSVFIYGHGCYKNEKRTYKNPNIHIRFNTELNSCSINDFSSPTFEERTFFFTEEEKLEYDISFKDPISETFDFNSLGVYLKYNDNIIRVHEFNEKDTTLSYILKYLNDFTYINGRNTVNVYCAICRNHCDGDTPKKETNKRSRSRSKSMSKSRSPPRSNSQKRSPTRSPPSKSSSGPPTKKRRTN